MSNITLVETDKTDAEKAKEYKEKVKFKLDEICNIIDDANKNGLEINFSLGKGPFGQTVTALIISKNFS